MGGTEIYIHVQIYKVHSPFGPDHLCRLWKIVDC